MDDIDRRIVALLRENARRSFADIGAHVLIGEEEHLGRYSVAIGRAVVRFLFKRPGVLRVVGPEG